MVNHAQPRRYARNAVGAEIIVGLVAVNGALILIPHAQGQDLVEQILGTEPDVAVLLQQLVVVHGQEKLG